MPCCRGGGDFIELPAEELSTIDRFSTSFSLSRLTGNLKSYPYSHLVHKLKTETPPGQKKRWKRMRRRGQEEDYWTGAISILMLISMLMSINMLIYQYIEVLKFMLMMWSQGKAWTYVSEGLKQLPAYCETQSCSKIRPTVKRNTSLNAISQKVGRCKSKRPGDEQIPLQCEKQVRENSLNFLSLVM